MLRKLKRTTPKLLLCTAFFAAASLSCQSSRDGSFQGRVYTDRYFHIAFELPSILEPQPTSSLNIHAAETLDGWPMAVGKQGTEPYGIVLIAQRLQEGPDKIKSAVGYLDRVEHTRGPGDTIGARGHQTSSHGFDFHWLDWKAANVEWDSAVIAQRGNYLLVARCNAKSVADLEAMKNALFGMHSVSK